MTRKKAETWEAYRAEWHRSGKSQRAYAEENGLSLSSFTRWLKKLSEEKTRQPGFVSLRLPKSISSVNTTMIIIRGTGRVCLEVPLTIGQDRLVELLRIMETSV